MASDLLDLLGQESEFNHFSWRWQNFRPRTTLDPEFGNIDAYSNEQVKTWAEKIGQQVDFEIIF
jgi:hypothetical protein